MRNLDGLPATYKLPVPRAARVEPAPDHLSAEPMPWPCPVCGGVVGDRRDAARAILEVTYPDGLELPAWSLS
jgi:hypothetical protein